MHALLENVSYSSIPGYSVSPTRTEVDYIVHSVSPCGVFDVSGIHVPLLLCWDRHYGGPWYRYPSVPTTLDYIAHLTV